MSSERFRERLLAGDRIAVPGGQPVSSRTSSQASPQSVVHLSIGGASAGPPPSRSARWLPQNWRLRTKLIALTVVPLGLALVLGGILIVRAASDSHASALREIVIIGTVALLALLLLLVLANSILRPLRVLRAAAFDVADRRLPAAIELLRTTDGRSGSVKIEPVPVYSREDVGQVARAFDAVHSEAVRLATEQAALRANVNDMFVNLSRRSQSLVERQLRLIDELELGEQDADRLAALFRLDHLATRMRRNGENLLVLAGAELRQRSGEAVPILDVLRASVSEVEDYQRVAVEPPDRAMIAGRAVNDIVHLVAELLDNATSYSDPESHVTLSARMTDYGGLVIEICDEGTGIPRARLVEINQRLAAPPPVDVSVSRQMGLFVVGKLGSRHGITVELMSADGSGLTVTVTLPPELVGDGSGAIGMIDDRPFTPQLPAPAPAPDGLLPTEPPPLPRRQPAYVSSIPHSDGFLDNPAVASASTFDTPIFNAMLSKWFTERQEPALALPPDTVSAPVAPNNPAYDGWESEADAGWRAADAASTPLAEEVTAAGLPKRRPGAFLVPGSVAPSIPAQPSPAGARSADSVRDRMSNLQRGLSLGRHTRSAGPNEQDPTEYDDVRHAWQASGEWPNDQTTEGSR
jgi:signal transduction histidine kinase